MIPPETVISQDTAISGGPVLLDGLAVMDGPAVVRVAQPVPCAMAVTTRHRHGSRPPVGEPESAVAVGIRSGGHERAEAVSRP